MNICQHNEWHKENSNCTLSYSEGDPGWTEGLAFSILKHFPKGNLAPCSRIITMPVRWQRWQTSIVYVDALETLRHRQVNKNTASTCTLEAITPCMEL